MYLNFCSEHPMSLKSSIPYSQFLRLKRIHTEPQHLLEAQIQMYFFLNLEGISPWYNLESLRTNKESNKGITIVSKRNQSRHKNTTYVYHYRRANQNLKELLSKHWTYLGRSSAHLGIGKTGLNDQL